MVKQQSMWASMIPAYLHDLRKKNSGLDPEQLCSNTITQNSVVRLYHKTESEKYLEDYRSPSGARSSLPSTNSVQTDIQDRENMLDTIGSIGSTIVTRNYKRKLLGIYEVHNWKWTDVHHSWRRRSSPDVSGRPNPVALQPLYRGQIKPLP